MLDDLDVDDLRKLLVVNGRAYLIGHPGTFFALKEIMLARGKVVPTSELRKLPGCKGRRLDQMLKKFAGEFKLFIRSIAGWHGGFWFQLPQESKNGARKSAKRAR